MPHVTSGYECVHPAPAQDPGRYRPASGNGLVAEQGSTGWVLKGPDPSRTIDGSTRA